MEQRVKILKEKIYKVCERAGRDPKEITIVAVTKTVGIERIEKAYQLGFRIFGENRVQEAREKIPALSHLKDAEWHLIGHLQKNKVKYAVKLFQIIQSVDSISLADEIEKRSEKQMNALIEVNTSGEIQKHGVLPDKALSLTEYVLKLEHISLLGFMTVGPYPVEEKKSRRAFSLLRDIRDMAEREFGVKFPVLSMGMSEDFEYAILEGSTMVRIGRAIFGDRK